MNLKIRYCLFYSKPRRLIVEYSKIRAKRFLMKLETSKKNKCVFVINKLVCRRIGIRRRKARTSLVSMKWYLNNNNFHVEAYTLMKNSAEGLSRCLSVIFILITAIIATRFSTSRLFLFRLPASSKLFLSSRFYELSIVGTQWEIPLKKTDIFYHQHCFDFKPITKPDYGLEWVKKDWVNTGLTLLHNTFIEMKY